MINSTAIEKQMENDTSLEDIKIKGLEPEINMNMKIEGKKCYVTNTCSFESLICLRKKKRISTAKLALDILNDGKILRDHYERRFQILRRIPYFEKGIQTKKLDSFSATSNVAQLYETLFEGFPNGYQKISCPQCKHERVRMLQCLSINAHVLFSNGYHFMQLAINELNTNFSNTTCRKCKGVARVSNTFETFIIIDLSLTTTKNFEEEFPQKNRKKYNLFGAVHYEEYKHHGSEKVDDSGALNHYTTFVYNGKQWSLHDDLQIRSLDCSAKNRDHSTFVHLCKKKYLKKKLQDPIVYVYS
ncbi:hypothetical protein FQA39_LY12400 [Lamprigera yunnana]|nr:hypothetical protein FQA39_LY12400 [Lamprigera yunnana]